MKKNNKKRDDMKNTMWAETWYRITRNRLVVLCMVIFAIIVVGSVFAPIIAPQGIDEQDVTFRFIAPCKEYWFGTDDFGRDIFSRILYGGRISLIVGVIATSISATLGIILGALAGYYGGKVDNIIMRIMDVFMAMPSMLLALAITAALGVGLTNTIIAVGVSSVPKFARVVRAPVLSERSKEYIEAAHTIGARTPRIIFLHIIPNVLAPIIVQATLNVASAIISASSLSFLGLGVQAPTPEWGSMLSAGRSYITDKWWLVMFPGAAIMLTVISLNVIGDGLRDALDPRLKQ